MRWGSLGEGVHEVCTAMWFAYTRGEMYTQTKKKTYTSAKYIVQTNPLGMDQYNGSRLERMNKICSRALLLKNSLLGEYLQS